MSKARGAHGNTPGIAAGLTLIASLSGLGCAAGGVMSPQGVSSVAHLDTMASRPLLASIPEVRSQDRGVAVTSISRAASFAARETTSPRAEGAAFTPQHSEAAEDRATALLLSATARCPADMALVDDRVCVDRWEASLVEHVSGRAERPWSPYLPVDGHELAVRAVSRPGVIPQGYISGKQAQIACMASGKRLCSGGEWERACRGPTHTQFPYGQDRRAGACNDDIRQVHPVAEIGAMLGIDRKDLWREGMNQPLINQLPGTLLSTGERAECTNEYGVYDMVGNLHEWIDDPDGTFRGGYYMDTSHNGEGCAYATTAHDFSYHDYSTGFRCCADPERVE